MTENENDVGDDDVEMEIYDTPCSNHHDVG